jgi:hypothetical protein
MDYSWFHHGSIPMIPLLDSSDHHLFHRSSPTFITSENLSLEKPNKNQKESSFLLGANQPMDMDGPPGLALDGALKASLKASTMFPFLARTPE